MTCWSCRGNSARSRVPQGASPCPPPRRATVPTWGRTAAAASRRPWLRRPRAAAQGNAGGSAPPRARRSHSGRPGAAIGPARHVGSPPRPSLPGARNPSPAAAAPEPRPSPGARGPTVAPQQEILEPALGAPAPRSHAGHLPGRDTFRCLLFCRAIGRGEFPMIRDVSGEISKCTHCKQICTPHPWARLSFPFSQFQR